MIYMQFIFSSFWVFVGHLALFYMILHSLGYFWHQFLKNLTIWLRGYPKKTVADQIIHNAYKKLKDEQVN